MIALSAPETALTSLSSEDGRLYSPSALAGVDEPKLCGLVIALYKAPEVAWTSLSSPQPMEIWIVTSFLSNTVQSLTTCCSRLDKRFNTVTRSGQGRISERYSHATFKDILDKLLEAPVTITCENG